MFVHLPLLVGHCYLLAVTSEQFLPQRSLMCVWLVFFSFHPLPVDHTRVVLHDGDPTEPVSDYINANIIMVRTPPGGPGFLWPAETLPSGLEEHPRASARLREVGADFLSGGDGLRSSSQKADEQVNLCGGCTTYSVQYHD